MPKVFLYVGLTLMALATIPPALIARARTRDTEARRIHLIQDMDNQARIRAQHASPKLDDGQPLFLDGRGMRPLVPGTVARGELNDDEHFILGVIADGWATTFPAPAPLTRELIERGRDRYTIYCTPCHGIAGYGDGMVHVRAMELVNNPAIGNGTVWVQPKSLHDSDIRDPPPGQIYNTITNGVRTMSGHAAQVPTRDRWAITAWVNVLQRSQNARPSDVPGGRVDSLPLVDLIPAEEEGQ